MASTHSQPTKAPTTHSVPEDDPFDSLLTLEDTLYTTAYTLGSTAGSRSGRIEGRLFGLEQGFDKFATLGQLHGRSLVWGSRISSSPSNGLEVAVEKEQGETPQLPTFKTNTSGRLTSSIHLLHGLTDPSTFSTENTEEAVADYDDRVRRAGAKVKVIERMIGESSAVQSSTSPDGSAAVREAGIRVKGEKEKNKAKGKGDENMEDFAGSRLIR